MKNEVKTEDHAAYLTSVSAVPEKKPAKINYLAKSDAELIASVSGAQLNQCRALLNEHSSLHGIESNTDLISAALELSMRYLYEKLERGDALCSPAQSRQYLQLQLGSYPHEVFACLFLDNRNRVIKFDKMFRGTIDGASVYPREVVKEALNCNAAAVIFAHNHPSGVAEPSHADETITKRLKDALSMVDIRVLDHFVIGDEVVSFAERGLL